MRVVILGGGAVGACTASFLATGGAEVAVVERHAVAGAASGRSGGFLARDWCDGTPVMALARRSFALHAQLAAELGGEGWGYRRMSAFSGTVGRPGIVSGMVPGRSGCRRRSRSPAGSGPPTRPPRSTPVPSRPP